MVPGEPVAAAENRARHRRRRRLAVRRGDESDSERQSRGERVERARIELPEQLPGSVVPPPRPAARESRRRAARPTSRGRGAHSCGRAYRSAGHGRSFWPSCNCRICSTWLHGSAPTPPSGARGHRRGRARGVSRRPAAALHGRRDPRGASGVGAPARPVADDARVRGRRGGRGPPADGDRALRYLECREAGRRAASAALHQPRGAARPAARAGGGARAHADGAGPRGAPRHDGFEVADLAHVRIAHGGAHARRDSTCRSARSGSSGDRAGRRAGRDARPAPEDGRLEGRPRARHDAPVRVAGLPDGRRPAGRLVGLPVPRARAVARGRRAAWDRRHVEAPG